MNSTVERLENVLRGLRKLTGRERPVVCVNCNARLTTSGQVFTVEGAEGTTSTYVNDHGAIHQIMTLREVDENKIGFQGRASVENTYFPGYCWRISYCRICYSHLGWKFQKLDESPNKTNRPSTFWGFMSSSVKTSR
jgi:cereblon